MISSRGLPILLRITMAVFTMIAMNMQYISSMSSASFVLDNSRLEGGGSTEKEQCTRARQMYQVTGTGKAYPDYCGETENTEEALEVESWCENHTIQSP